MTESEFYKHINGELTISGALPNFLPENEIRRIVKESSMFFYENYYNSTQIMNYVIFREVFENEMFKKNRQIVLPDNVISVSKVKEIKGINRVGIIDRDFSEEKFIASELFLSAYYGDDLVYLTARYHYFDLAKAYFLQDISYDFNKNTKILKIIGRTPKYNVFLETHSKIPIEKLYDDYYFLRYVIAKCKISLARMLGLYDYQLPGGVKINSDVLRSEGEQEVEWILNKIQEEDQPNWIISFH